jgi:hypothetical protein
MIFDGPKGLRYDTARHDFVEPNGELASPEARAISQQIRDQREPQE